MTLEIAEHREMTCTECGCGTTVLMWLAVDFAARPDVRTAFEAAEGVVFPCENCDARLLRDDPLVILGLAAAVPAAMAYSESLDAADNDARTEALETLVAEPLRHQGRVLPEFIYLPFDVLLIAFARNIDQDVAHQRTAVLWATRRFGMRTGNRYGTFLRLVRAAESPRQLDRALEAVSLVNGVEALKKVLSEYPVLRTQAARDRRAATLESIRSLPPDHDFGMPRALALSVAVAALELLERCAKGDLKGAWATYESTLREHQLFLKRLTESLLDNFKKALREDAGRAAQIGEQLLEKISELGVIPMETEALYNTASAYFEREDGDRGDHIERGSELLGRAIMLCDQHPNAVAPGMHALILMNAATALGQCRRGDPAANFEQAITFQRQALEILPAEDRARWGAAAHTNLGQLVLERDRFLSAADEDERQAEPRENAALSEAILNFERALTSRTFKRDPLGWGYTQLNLAVAHCRWLGQDRSAHLRLAIAHSNQAVRGFKKAGEVALSAQAMGSCAIAHVDLAALPGTSPADRDELVATAEAYARGAIALIGEEAQGVDAGQRWSELARVLCHGRQYSWELVRIVRRALRELTPETAPRACRDTGRPLAEIAAETGHWAVAAEMWEQVARAAAAAVESRATRIGRFNEIAANGHVFRFAAYALIKAGARQQAVELLELGRARELSAWLERDVVDLRPLRAVDPQLCGRFVDLRHRIETAERAPATTHDPAVARAYEDLAQTVREIRRRLPGPDGFLTRPKIGELALALPAEETIAYPVISPSGSAWLLLRAGVRGHPDIDVVDVPSLTLSTAYEALWHLDPDSGEVTGYLAEQAVTGAELNDEIGRVSSVLGAKLMMPLARWLQDAKRSSVCIVPIGLLGLVPLHALTWEQDSAERCLLDDVVVAYAPSAYVRHVSRARASSRQEFKRLVVVGNPLPQSEPLSGAAREAEVVAATVAIGDRLLPLTGKKATKDAVMDAMPSASHIHLACHGRAAANPVAFDAALWFAHDRTASAAELLDVDLSRARLVVASACETGLVAGYDSVDEALALSSVFLAAGAAGVVASLWRVNDYATALLMARFYEQLMTSPENPAAALRVAQLWLRDLDPNAEANYVATRSILKEKCVEQTRAAGLQRPFGAATTWAAFVFVGA